MSQIMVGWAHPREIEEAMTRGIIAGSEAFGCRHRAQWISRPRAVSIRVVGTPMGGTRSWRQISLGKKREETGAEAGGGESES